MTDQRMNDHDKYLEKKERKKKKKELIDRIDDVIEPIVARLIPTNMYALYQHGGAV